MAKYYKKNDIHIVEIPAEEFAVVMVDKRKKSCGKGTASGGYFGGYHEEGSYFTLLVGHLVCDFEASNKWTRYYCEQRGKFSGNKFTFDSSKWVYMNSFHGKAVSTLFVANGSASIVDTVSVPDGLDYAVSGVPIMRNGEDVKYQPYVRGQGWDASPFRATWSNFIGLKEDGKVIYLMGMQTTTSNMVLSAEAFHKFKPLGMRDVIKLDGGGSFYLNADGTVHATAENRQINTIIRFPAVESGNPYREPTVALRKGNSNKEGNKWLQWYLNHHGYTCAIDGSFGRETNRQLLQFQSDRNLDPDGSCGPLTKAELKIDR